MTYKRTLVFFSLLAIASPSYAYLDPGTGSMILQGIIAGVAVAGLTLKTYWYRFKCLFSRDKSSTDTNVQDEDNTSS